MDIYRRDRYDIMLVFVRNFRNDPHGGQVPSDGSMPASSTTTCHIRRCCIIHPSHRFSWLALRTSRVAARIPPLFPTCTVTCPLVFLLASERFLDVDLAQLVDDVTARDAGTTSTTRTSTSIFQLELLLPSRRIGWRSRILSYNERTSEEETNECNHRR